MPAKEPTPNQHVHDISKWLTDVQRRTSAGEKTPPPKPIEEVLRGFSTSPAAHTRVQILAAAAAARHLEGEDSDKARQLHTLAADTDNRIRALREHERRTEALAHTERGSTPEEVADHDQQRRNRDASTDRRIFDAAAAVSLGYVAANGVPAYTDLAHLSETQIGPAPEQTEQGRESVPSEGQRSDRQLKQALDSVGRGLARAAGPAAGDDEVAPNLSPVNITQVNEEFIALIKPALKAAMSGHPRTVRELLNTKQTPDEENEQYFQHGAALETEAERDTEVSR